MYILIIALIVALDQITKVVIYPLIQDSPISVIDGIFEFKFFPNRGAFLGMFENARWVFLSLSTIAIIAMVAFLIWKHRYNKLLTVSIAMMAGGGIGNMIDRIRLGYVIDFLYAKIIDFPIFNVADSFVTIGSGLLIIYLIKSELDERKKRKADSSSSTDTEKSDD